MAKSDDIARYRANLQGEIDGASLYRALAGAESDPRLAEVYGRLAAVEEAHAEFWRKQLARTGARVGGLRAGWRSRALAWLARRFGPQFVLPTTAWTMRECDRSAEGSPPSRASGWSS